MTEIDRYLENIGMWRKTSWSLIMVTMMILSTLAGMSVALTDDSESDWEDSVKRTTVQTGDQYDQPYRENANRGDIASPFTHPALMDPAYGDYGVMYGKVSDLSLLDLRADGWTLHLEERIGDDHDNDGIDDLNDLDDDNDGIYDLIERFDGCFGTGPLDHDNDGISDIEQVFTDGFNYPFGIEITSDFLYVADLDFVWKIPYKEGQLKNDKDPIKLTKDNALGDINGHRTRNIVLLDNKIYIAIGSRGNIGVEDYPRATIQEFDLKTNEQKNFATGLRNPIGLDVHPVTKKLFTVVNERDGMGDELVPDYFAQVEEGDFFGWPFFYLGHNEQPNLEKNYFYFKNIEQKKNKLVKKPEVLFKSHSGPIDLIFYNKKQFPKEFQSNAFVALHGSWNSSKPSGYMVVRIPFENNKPLGYYESFVTGFWVSDANRANVCGRPAGLGVTKNGSLLISDDINGVIYQINSN